MKIGKHDYDDQLLRDNMMGPNAMKVLDELARSMELKPGMRVLDLGCGKGLTSIYLAKEYGVTVYATDLWIEATDNYQRFKSLGLDKQIIPIHADALELPYANSFFDAAVCIDAYHYFGAEGDYLNAHLAPLVREGGQMAIAVPGLQHEFVDGIPEALKPFYEYEYHFHTTDWWKQLWDQSDLVEVKRSFSMKCHDEAWSDWLSTDNPHAQEDVAMMKAEGGRYFNHVGMVAHRVSS